MRFKSSLLQSEPGMRSRLETNAHLTRLLSRRLTRRDTANTMNIHLRGHNFQQTEFDISTLCEHCQGLLWMLELGFVCWSCKMTVHRHCVKKCAIVCSEKRNSSNSIETDPLKTRSYFGQSLNVVLKREKRKIPQLMEACIRLIESKGVNTGDLYRKSVDVQTVKALKYRVDRGDLYCLEKEKIHTLTTLFKQYIRELPEPLVPRDHYSAFIHSLDIPNKDEVALRLLDLVGKLPAQNQACLEVLMFHLAWVVKQPRSNMTPHSIAIVFGPILLRPPASMSADIALLDISKQSNVIERLLSAQVDRIEAIWFDIHSVSHAISVLRRAMNHALNPSIEKGNFSDSELNVIALFTHLDIRFDPEITNIQRRINSAEEERLALVGSLPSLEPYIPSIMARKIRKTLRESDTFPDFIAQAPTKLTSLDEVVEPTYGVPNKKRDTVWIEDDKTPNAKDDFVDDADPYLVPGLHIQKSQHAAAHGDKALPSNTRPHILTAASVPAPVPAPIPLKLRRATQWGEAAPMQNAAQASKFDQMRRRTKWEPPVDEPPTVFGKPPSRPVKQTVIRRSSSKQVFGDDQWELALNYQLGLLDVASNAPKIDTWEELKQFMDSPITRTEPHRISVDSQISSSTTSDASNKSHSKSDNKPPAQPSQLQPIPIDETYLPVRAMPPTPLSGNAQQQQFRTFGFQERRSSAAPSEDGKSLQVPRVPVPKAVPVPPKRKFQRPPSSALIQASSTTIDNVVSRKSSPDIVSVLQTDSTSAGTARSSPRGSTVPSSTPPLPDGTKPPIYSVPIRGQSGVLLTGPNNSLPEFDFDDELPSPYAETKGPRNARPAAPQPPPRTTKRPSLLGLDKTTL